MVIKKGDKKIEIGKLSLSERSVSVALGVGVVLVIGALMFNYFKEKTREGELVQEKQEEVQVQEREETLAVDLPVVYQVEKGDNLWKIAEKFYQSGYNWIDIAKENNLKNPNLIAVGQELKIPDVKAGEVTVVEGLPETGIKAVTPGSEYTVQEGDWLSKIALWAYGDMFAWEKIYQTNRTIIGPDPHSIEPGIVLTIPE